MEKEEWIKITCGCGFPRWSGFDVNMFENREWNLDTSEHVLFVII